MTITLVPPGRRLQIPLALGVALALTLPATAAQAQRRRCPTCAPTPERPPGGSTEPAPRGGVSARRGTPGSVVPLTDADITIGGARYTSRVDAECATDPKASASNTRFYYRVLYPWFGYRPPADQAQWRFSLEIRPGSGPGGASNQFVFSFHDADRKNGVIQNVAFSKTRYGSGSVRVTRHGAGARFEVVGRTDNGEAVRAIFDCSQFQGSEAAGG